MGQLFFSSKFYSNMGPGVARSFLLFLKEKPDIQCSLVFIIAQTPHQGFQSSFRFCFSFCLSKLLSLLTPICISPSSHGNLTLDCHYASGSFPPSSLCLCCSLCRLPSTSHPFLPLAEKATCTHSMKTSLISPLQTEV